MNAKQIADELENIYWIQGDGKSKPFQQYADFVRQQQSEIEALKERIERMIENASHHEGIAHAGGFEQGYEAGRKMGMQQERALWELAASTQEIMK